MVYVVVSRTDYVDGLGINVFDSLKKARNFMCEEWLDCLGLEKADNLPKDYKKGFDGEDYGIDKMSAWIDCSFWNIYKKNVEQD